MPAAFTPLDDDMSRATPRPAGGTPFVVMLGLGMVFTIAGLAHVTIQQRVMLDVLQAQAASAAADGQAASVGHQPDVHALLERPSGAAAPANKLTDNHGAQWAPGLHKTNSRHLMLEIHGADPVALDSEDVIRQLFKDVCAYLDVTILGIQSHRLQPMGVSVVLVLSESHLSIHTWPESGYAAVDLFTCGTANPMDGMEMMVKGLRANFSTWSLTNRGLGPAYEADDIETLVLTDLYATDKRLVEHVKSSYQDIQVWELKSSWHMKADVTRCLFLDGIVQSCLQDEHVYHEALVQPAMFAHPEPRHVAIVGGGEGATLREVLRHKTVVTATMVELDNDVVEVAKRSLPSMPGASWQDPRAHLVNENAYDWFETRYGETKGECVPPSQYSEGGAGHPCLDVIIMDVQDPETVPTFTVGLFSASFMATLTRSLSEDGVLVWQIGEALSAVRDSDLKRLKLMQMMSGFSQGINVYHEMVPSFQDSWSFMVSFMSQVSLGRFHRNTAEIDMDIHTRLRAGEGLQYFDGAQMQNLQETPSAYQFHFCSDRWRAESPEPEHVDRQCQWLRQQHTPTDDAGDPEGYLEVRRSAHFDRASVFAARPIAQGHRFGDFNAATSLELPESAYRGLAAFAQTHKADAPKYQAAVDWLDEYSYFCPYGGGSRFVSLQSKLAFTDHVCEESDSNIVGFDTVNMTQEQIWNAERNEFSLVFERNRRSACVEQVAKRSIAASDELLGDYRSYLSPDKDRPANVHTVDWATRPCARKVGGKRSVRARRGSSMLNKDQLGRFARATIPQRVLTNRVAAPKAKAP